jgi:hypothetical protein
MTLNKEEDYAEVVGMCKEKLKRLFGDKVRIAYMDFSSEIRFHVSVEALSAFNNWISGNLKGEGSNDATLKGQSQTIEIIGIKTCDYLSTDIADNVAYALSTDTLDIFKVQKFGNGFTAKSFNYCGSKYVITTRNTFNPASEFYYACLDADNNIIRVTFDAHNGPKDRQIVYCFNKEDVYNVQ